MIIYVHSYDIFDAGITWSRHSSASDVQHIVLRPKDTIQSMVNRIISTARNERSIYTLVINAHGVVLNGCGTPLGCIRISASATLDAATAVQMETLRPYFSDSCNGLELHSCEVLGAGDGWTMCRTLSRCLNVSVYASVAPQLGVVEWYRPGRDAHGRFEGRTYRFRPDGTFVYSDPELRRRGLHE